MTNLYDRDFTLWVEQIVIAIKKRDFENMDWENLLEEIEDMGKSEKRSLDSYMQRLIEHILKLKYWYSEVDKCRNGWKSEVSNSRNRIKRILKKNPSLKSYLEREYKDIYLDAVKNMAFNFDIPEDNFVQLEQIINEEYFGFPIN